jgi:hypothetical protein
LVQVAIDAEAAAGTIVADKDAADKIVADGEKWCGRRASVRVDSPGAFVTLDCLTDSLGWVALGKQCRGLCGVGHFARTNCAGKAAADKAAADTIVADKAAADKIVADDEKWYGHSASVRVDSPGAFVTKGCCSDSFGCSCLG